MGSEVCCSRPAGQVSFFGGQGLINALPARRHQAIRQLFEQLCETGDELFAWHLLHVHIERASTLRPVLRKFSPVHLDCQLPTHRYSIFPKPQIQESCAPLARHCFLCFLSFPQQLQPARSLWVLIIEQQNADTTKTKNLASRQQGQGNKKKNSGGGGHKTTTMSDGKNRTKRGCCYQCCCNVELTPIKPVAVCR